MTHELIRVEYDLVRSVQSSFQDYADKSAQWVTRLLSQVEVLESGYWQGENADRFYRTMRQDVLPALQRLVDAFRDADSTTAEIIRIFETAEEEAASRLDWERDVTLATFRAGDIAYGGGGGQWDGESGISSVNDREIRRRPGPSATDEQMAELVNLHITLADGETLTQTEAQSIIDYFGSDDRANVPILDEVPYTAIELLEVTARLNEMSLAGFELGQSYYQADTWSLDEVRQLSAMTETMAVNAMGLYMHGHTPEEFIALAAYYDLPVDQAHFGPLKLLLGHDRDSNPITIRRDAGGNVNYVQGENGGWVPGAGVWYARADGNSLIFGERAFFEGTQNGPTGGTFTTSSLIAHEITHKIVSNWEQTLFQQITDDMTDNDGYVYTPRSSNLNVETTTDLLTNALLDGFTDDAEGRERALEARQLLYGARDDRLGDPSDDGIFVNRDPVPDSFSVDEGYAQRVGGRYFPGVPISDENLI